MAYSSTLVESHQLTISDENAFVRVRPFPFSSRPACQPSLIGLVLICCALTPSARGASFSDRAQQGPSVSSEEHRCACKSCRGESSCCCSHDENIEHTPAPAHLSPALSLKSSALPVFGPCLGAAPCSGDEGLPPSHPGPSVSKAALGESIVIHSGAGRLRSHPFVEPFLPASLDDRLDEPPELPATA